MALVADRVLEGSTTTGTGNFALTGAFAGHRSFNGAFASGSSVLYCIEDGVNWEVGVGTFTAPSTLARTVVQSSSNGGSLVDFPTGAKRVFNTYTAASLAPASGGASGLEMTASTTTTDADPGTGVIRWNNSTQASATILFIDNADSNSASLATLWASTATGSFLKIINALDSDNWQLWKVTAVVSATGYYKFTVTLQASSGAAFANGIALLLDVDEAGSGSASPTTTKGDLIVRGASADQRLAAPSVDNFQLVFDLATGLPVWKAPSGGGGSATGTPAAWSLKTASAGYTSAPGNWTIASGNRDIRNDAAVGGGGSFGGASFKSIASKSSGKWYFELLATSLSGSFLSLGVMSAASAAVNDPTVGSGRGDVWVRSNGQGFSDGSNNYEGAFGGWSNGDIIGVAFEVGVNVKFYRNNTLFLTKTLTTAVVSAFVAFESSGALQSAVRFAAADLTYAPPSGYVAWGDDAIFVSPTVAKGDLIVRGASADQRLAAPSVDDYRLAFDLATGLPVWKAPSSSQKIAIDATTARTLSLADVDSYTRMTNASAKTFTFPLDATYNAPIGAEGTIRNVGAGACTLVATATVNLPAGGSLVVNQGMTVGWKKVGASEFDLFGQTV